jgi:dTDP-glucose 4,6-dehydratase
MCMAYFREHRVDIRIARIFNTYGTRMRLNDGRVIPTFITQALKNKDITIFGNGSHTRSFCFIDDLTAGIYNLSIKDGLAGEVMNLGNPEEIAVRDLADMIIQKTGSRSKIIFKDIPEDDPPRRQPDIRKAHEMLGFSTRVPLSEGLDRIIPWFEREIGLVSDCHAGHDGSD